MTINFKVILLVFGPLLFWSIPAASIFLTSTHYWLSLLIPFMGFYPGPVIGSNYWHNHALNELLLTIWGCLALVGYAALGSFALRKNSQAVAATCAILITLSSLVIFCRINFLGW
jgi:hypothetical protein